MNEVGKADTVLGLGEAKASEASSRSTRLQVEVTSGRNGDSGCRA